ncbi:hypothetical protein LR48_Vigan01g024900 [Vigna angularis]|uniref:Uncharacterized protein n=1 Tax=Phaseolus angularis TaxID=3914 RepID=A0A0L9TJG0_PHAAN|nr:hypothetical protein LR48_Vigan01g024900 [Vigna angularis]
MSSSCARERNTLTQWDAFSRPPTRPATIGASTTILAIIDTAEHLEVNIVAVFCFVSNRPERSKPDDMEDMNSNRPKRSQVFLRFTLARSVAEEFLVLLVSPAVPGAMLIFCPTPVSNAGLVGMGYVNVTSGGGGAAVTLCVWPAMPIHNHNPSVNPVVGFVHAPSFTNRVGVVGGNVVNVSSSFVATTHGLGTLELSRPSSPLDEAPCPSPSVDDSYQNTSNNLFDVRPFRTIRRDDLRSPVEVFEVASEVAVVESEREDGRGSGKD